VTHFSGFVVSCTRLRPKKPIARLDGTPSMKNLLFEDACTLHMFYPTYASPSSPKSTSRRSFLLWMYT